MQVQSLGEAEKLRRDRTNLRQNGDGVRHDDGACGCDGALHDDGVVRAMFHVGVGYVGASVGHEDGVEGVGNVGENGTGLRALGAADGAGQGVVAADGCAGVGANDGGWVSGRLVGLGISLFPCRDHSSPSVPSLPCAARPQHPNPFLQQA